MKFAARELATLYGAAGPFQKCGGMTTRCWYATSFEHDDNI